MAIFKQSKRHNYGGAMNKTNALIEIINREISDLWLLSSSILDYIYSRNADEQLNTFTSFLKDIDFNDFDIPELDEYLNLSSENYVKFTDISKTTSRILQNLINSNVTEAEFYSKLWNKLNDSDLFPTNKDKIAFLLSLWLDMRIPYYSLVQGCSMEIDEYLEAIKKISPALKKARFIICTKFGQRMQRASLLMDLAESIEDYRLRVVFWTQSILLLTKLESEFDNSDDDEKQDND